MSEKLLTGFLSFMIRVHVNNVLCALF